MNKITKILSVLLVGLLFWSCENSVNTEEKSIKGWYQYTEHLAGYTYTYFYINENGIIERAGSTREEYKDSDFNKYSELSYEICMENAKKSEEITFDSYDEPIWGGAENYTKLEPNSQKFIGTWTGSEFTYINGESIKSSVEMKIDTAFNVTNTQTMDFSQCSETLWNEYKKHINAEVVTIDDNKKILHGSYKTTLSEFFPSNEYDFFISENEKKFLLIYTPSDFGYSVYNKK